MTVEHNNLMVVCEERVVSAEELLTPDHRSRLEAAPTLPRADVVVHTISALPFAVLPYECLLSLLCAMPLA